MFGILGSMKHRTGVCHCGQVQVAVHGEPLRVGVCHCTNCRKESGSAFTFYGVWPVDQFEYTGHTAVARAQHFCPGCGAPLFSMDDAEAEIKLGLLSEAPSGLTPTYELWVKRREPWLQPIPGAEQHDEDRR